MNKLKEIAMAVIEGENEDVAELVQEALDAGFAPTEVLDEGLIAPINELGEQFKNGEIFIPDLMVAAEAMQEGVALIRPLLVEGDIKKIGKVVICTVEGDMHDIGKNLVAMMLENAGFEVNDLGMDVPVDAVVEAVVQDPQVQIVCMSAMLTTTMQAMDKVIAALKGNGNRDRVKVMIGGAPVSQEYADRIEADGYSVSASEAVELAKSLIAG